jgi:O-antigen/teichoic acid export membrane protein
MRRIILGVTGQATFRGVTALGSVLVIPALIHGWGVKGYGEWIALTALLSYMSYSNFGLVSTSMNEMIMASGAGDFSRAARVFQMSINLTLYVIAPILLAASILLVITPAFRIMNFHTISKYDASWITVIVSSQMVLLTLRGILVAVLYSGGSYGFVYYVLSATKLTEFLFISIGVALFRFKPLQAASVSAGIALFEVIVIAILAKRAAGWMRVNFRIFEPSWVSGQAKPSLGFLLGGFAINGILLQGGRIVMNALLGGSAVAVYAIYGTAMRLIDQLLQMVALPLEVEMAHSLGRNDLAQTRRLVALGTQFSWVLFVGVGLALMAFGPFIFHWWTAGRIPFSRQLMSLYLCMSMCNLVGRISNHALISTNRMYGPSFVMVACALIAVGLGGVLTMKFGIAGMVVGGIFGEISNSLVSLFFVSRLLDCTPITLLQAMVNFRGSLKAFEYRARLAIARYRGA